MESTYGKACGCGLLLLIVAMSVNAAEDVSLKGRLVLPTEDAVGFARAVAADPSAGDIFVCDSRFNRILIFDERGDFRYLISGGSIFSSPLDIAVDREGFLYLIAIREGTRSLMKLDFDGMFLYEILRQEPSSEEPDSEPVSVAVSPSGERLFVLDARKLEIQILSPEGQLQGVIDLVSGLDEGQRAEAEFGKLDVYGDTLLLAATSESAVRRFDLDGNEKTPIGIRGQTPCKLSRPAAAAMTINREIVVVDRQRMVFTLWSEDENLCVGEYSGSGTLPGFLYYPTDTALDSSGRVYVSQGFEGRVQAFGDIAPAAGSGQTVDDLTQSPTTIQPE